MKTKIPTTTIVNLWSFRFGSNLSTLSPHNAVWMLKRKPYEELVDLVSCEKSNDQKIQVQTRTGLPNAAVSKVQGCGTDVRGTCTLGLVLQLYIYILFNYHSSYGHRLKNTRHPVRSAISKLQIARLVWESLVL